MSSSSNNIILAVLGLAVILYIALVFDAPYDESSDSFETCVAMGNLVMESHPRQCRDGDGNLFVEVITPTPGGTRTGGVGSDMVNVVMPAAGATVASPLQLSGTARGNWFFEASFPIQVYGADGKVLGSGIATAQGEWMTEDFVPFTATISFTPGMNASGYVRLSKDNPSGLPEYDAFIDLPVLFK